LACHASPFGSHTDRQKTYYCLITQFWWPCVYQDVVEAIRGCTHCRLANATSHKNQQVLQALPCDELFDVITLNFWDTGEITLKLGASKLLMCLCVTTNFASGAFLDKEDSQSILFAAFAYFFVPNGLPRLVIIDAGSSFVGMMEEMCNLLRIPYHKVSKENHCAILVEHFH
jgi:hypothetical protein